MNLRHLFPWQDDPAEAPALERLRQARITAETVLDPAPVDPRALPPVSGDAAASPLPRPRRPMPFDGLRLIPLDGFCWGGAVQRARAGQGARPRVRGDHVLILVQNGGATIGLPRSGHPVSAGRLAFVPAGTAFALQPGMGCRGLVLLVPPMVAQQLAVDLPPAWRCGPPRPDDAPLIEPALRNLGRGMPRGSADLAAAACQLGLLAAALNRPLPASPDPETQTNIDFASLAERFLAVAKGRLDRDIVIADLAADLGCTVAQLDRACRAARGRSALELIYALRLERAARLLRDTDQPVTQIAQELGYGGLGHFMRCFMAGTGQTPDHFRAMVRSEAAE